MPDLLLDVWHLLEPGERPEGMVYRNGDWMGYSDDESAWMGSAAAYDRLCQAAERVNAKRGLMLAFRGDWTWLREYGEYDIGYHVIASNPDRLRAATDAMRAHRVPPSADLAGGPGPAYHPGGEPGGSARSADVPDATSTPTTPTPGPLGLTTSRRLRAPRGIRGGCP